MADEEKPLDAGHVYSPHFWFHKTPWVREAGSCCHAVHDGFGVGFHQCGKKAKVTRDVLHDGKLARYEYCGVHDPVAVKAKREAREAKWKAEWAAKDAKWAEESRLRKLRDDALEAIKAIAKGHNDPRTLALDVLAKHGEEL